MDCSTFKEQHLAFSDGTLPDAELVAMQGHLNECESCARHDIAMRRGLLVLRNIPDAEPSPDFHARLREKIRKAELGDARAAQYRGPGIGTFAAAAAGVLAAGFMAVAAVDRNHPAPQLRLDPIVAMQPEVSPAVLEEQFVMSAATGASLWPAAIFAEQMPVHFIAASFPFEDAR